ncbi:MAG: TRAP transporter substrate-binding protein [Burkholderiales bacterium]
MRRKLLLVGLAGAAIALVGGPAVAQETVLRVAHSSNPGQSVYIYWDELAKRVNQKAAGKLRLQVHPSGQLGGDEQVFRGLKLGTIHMGSGAAANLGVVTDGYFWMDLPYVFKSRDGASRVFADSTVDAYLRNKLRNDAGTHLLGHIEVGGYRILINTKRPLKTPEDVKGLKFRALSNPVDIALLQGWGFTPTPLPWSETFPSLQQGVIDGLNLQPQAIKGFGFGDVVKYGTLTQTLMTFHVAQVSQKSWEALSPDLQKIVQDAAAEALKIANDADRADESKFMSELKAKVTFYTPTAEELKRWEAPARAIWPKFQDKIDQKVLDRVLASQS